MDTEKAPTIEQLMQKAMAGDKQAYANVLCYTTRLVRPFLYRKLSQPNDVDDVLQEILLSIHKARHTYDCQRPYNPWAFAIARFRLNDYLRAHYNDKLEFTEFIDDLSDMLDDNVTKLDFTYESIKGEIEQLPQKQAVILQMMHEEGYTAKEVAHKIGMKESAVKVAAHRAYKVLRTKLGTM